MVLRARLETPHVQGLTQPSLACRVHDAFEILDYLQLFDRLRLLHFEARMVAFETIAIEMALFSLRRFEKVVLLL